MGVLVENMDSREIASVRVVFKVTSVAVGIYRPDGVDVTNIVNHMLQPVLMQTEGSEVTNI